MCAQHHGLSHYRSGENAPGNVPLHRRQTTGKCSTVRLRDGVGFVATEVTRQLTAPESIGAYLPDIRCELEPGDRLVSSSTRSSQARERRNRSRTSAVRAVLRNFIARLQIRAILNLLDDGSSCCRSRSQVSTRSPPSTCSFSSPP